MRFGWMPTSASTCSRSPATPKTKPVAGRTTPVHPRWRTLIADWEQEAARHVAMYRAAMTIHLDDPAWTALPARLAQLSPDFARFWASSDVAGPERRLKRFRHPSAGPLTLHSTSLLMADDPMIRIMILYPATASDAAKLERLAGNRY